MPASRRRPPRILLAALALAAAAAPAAALEIGLEARSGNIEIPWTQVAPTPPAVTVYPATALFWGGRAWFTETLGEDAEIRVAYERDPVLRNTLYASVLFERGVAKIAVGPLVGLWNSASAPFSAGISAQVSLRWPGVAYVSVRSDGGLAIGLIQSADPQAQAELAAGFYVRNAIVSAIVAAKRFNETDSGGSLLTDSWSRYALAIDIFKKNVPYTLVASIGYELRSKRYEAAAKTDSLGAIVLGARASAGVAPGVKMSLDLSSGFYTFGLDELQGRGPAGNSFMFSAGIGVAFDLGLMRGRGPAPETPAPAAAPAAATDDETPTP